MTEERSTVEVDKPVKDDDAKNAIGEKLGPFAARYKNTRTLREAKIEITVTIFEPKTPSSKKGYFVTLTGILEAIDFTAMAPMIKIEGRKVKLSEIVNIEAPEIEEEYTPHELTAREKEDLKKAQAALEKEMRTQFEKQMARERQKWENSDPFPDYDSCEMPAEETKESRKKTSKWDGYTLYAKKRTEKKKKNAA
ncbi:MAG: hypothetical protein IJV40_15895 [Oscillospiraceae bacterium]|nr:hypothetical protein [Oscillospiraceae bacterium]